MPDKSMEIEDFVKGLLLYIGYGRGCKGTCEYKDTIGCSECKAKRDERTLIASSIFRDLKQGKENSYLDLFLAFVEGEIPVFDAMKVVKFYIGLNYCTGGDCTVCKNMVNLTSCPGSEFDDLSSLVSLARQLLKTFAKQNFKFASSFEVNESEILNLIS